jgi:hypothetical protein
MRKLILFLPLAIFFFATFSHAESVPFRFPLDQGRMWVFDDGNFDQTVSFIRVEIGGVAVSAFVFEPYDTGFGKRIFYRDGDKIYEWRDTWRRLRYDFGAKPGASWKMTWTPTKNAAGTVSSAPPDMADLDDGSEVTLVANDESVSVPYGDFKNVAHFRIIRPGVADAGYVEEWFAPGIGCIQRVRDTIAGPRMQKLVKLVLPAPISPLRLDVALDREYYAPGDSIVITVTVLNTGDHAAALSFPSTLQADYSIDNTYQWSRGRAFATLVTSVSIPAGGVHSWTFTHTAKEYPVPPGKHTVTAVIAGTTLTASRDFLVQQAYPHLPPGMSLSIATGKETYHQGEPVSFTLTAKNTSAADVTLGIQGGIPMRFWVDAPNTVPGPAVGIMTPVKETTLKPGESLTFPGVITADTILFSPGTHELFAGLAGYDDVVSVKFSVVVETALGKVTGTVYAVNESGGRIPLAGANVALVTTVPSMYDAVYSNMPRARTLEFNAVTDAAGKFVLDGVTVGAFHTLTVKKDGYTPYVGTVRTLMDTTTVDVTLRPAPVVPDGELNVKRHTVAGILVALGADRSVYTPDSPFKATFGITNTLNTEVKFTFAGEPFVDWYLETTDGSIQLLTNETAKAALSAETSLTLAPGETRTFTRTSTFRGRTPAAGGKYSIRASLRYTATSIPTLKPGDIGDYLTVLVTPSATTDRLNAQGYEKEMVVDLRTTSGALINITTNKDNVSGDLAVSGLSDNYHAPKTEARFIKMIEIDADSTIRADMDSALVRVYFDPAEFAAAGTDPKFLVLSHWDDRQQNPAWQDLVTRVDTVNNFVEAWTKSFSSFGLFDTGPSISVEETGPAVFRLDQNAPNPFNPVTTITFRLPDSGRVTLTVYNSAGQTVARLIDGFLAAGEHRAVFLGDRFASGVYFYRLAAPGFVGTRKMLLIK